MPRQAPPQCAADHAASTAARRNCRRCWLAHPSLQITTMKFPISWHIQGLENMRKSYAKKAEQLRREAESLESDAKRIAELESQIQRGKARRIRPGEIQQETQMNAIRINSRAIQCVADADGATEYVVRYGGRDFIVTAHSKAEAEEAAEYYRAEPDATQPELLP